MSLSRVSFVSDLGTIESAHALVLAHRYRCTPNLSKPNSEFLTVVVTPCEDDREQQFPAPRVRRSVERDQSAPAHHIASSLSLSLSLSRERDR